MIFIFRLVHAAPRQATVATPLLIAIVLNVLTTDKPLASSI